MKTSLLILLATSFGLWAQSPASPPAFPAFPTNAAINSNRQQLIQRQLQRALERQTNALAPGLVGNSARVFEGTNPSAVSPASTNQPRPQPATTPGSGATPNLPTGTITPATGLAAPPAGQVTPVTTPPTATGASTEDTIPPGMIKFQRRT